MRFLSKRIQLPSLIAAICLALPLMAHAVISDLGKIPHNATFDAGESPPSNNFFPVTGTVDGINFSRNEDGSADFTANKPAGNAINGWSVQCAYDVFSESSACAARQGSLMVMMDKRCKPSVEILGKVFTGTNITVKTGADAPVSSDARSGSYLSAILSARVTKTLSSGHRVLTRFQEWPSKSFLDTEIDPDGFAVAYRYACWAAKSLTKP